MPTAPPAPSSIRDGWPVVPQTAPPMPFTDWPYGGTTLIVTYRVAGNEAAGLQQLAGPVDGVIGEQAHVAASRRDADLHFTKTRLQESDWDPYAFVDLCQAVARGQTAARELCLDIQQAEWELLFDHCYQRALGGGDGS